MSGWIENMLSVFLILIHLLFIHRLSASFDLDVRTSLDQLRVAMPYFKYPNCSLH
jgi:hypothetical protein